jgi:phosphate starvation-inducible PhoH-like protein
MTHDINFGIGTAGTGKTYLAVACAVDALERDQIRRILLVRPAVEAGERLGFLPGDLSQKIDPYLRPLYDALYDMLPGPQVIRSLESGEIEIAPLAFMRGRTLANSFVILDESQNATPMQMKMFLTRMGENSRMVITGDPSQVDLPFGAKSGLKDALEILPKIKGCEIIHFSEDDVVRHDMVTRIVKAYNKRDGKLPPMQRHPKKNLKKAIDEKPNEPGDDAE